MGPSPDEEAALLAVEPPAPPAANPAEDGPEPDPATPLPPLEDLVQRIPAPARELMEELFRARFVAVKRLPKSALKPQALSRGREA